MRNKLTINGEDITRKIYTFRGLHVMLDSDLAELYGVYIKRLNEQVNRNIDRFPEDFMFQLTKVELESLRSHFATSKGDKILVLQIGTSKKSRGGRRYLPYAFTEQGVATLSGVLRSKKAIEVNIQIMRAFVSMRKFILQNGEIFNRLDTVERKQVEYQISTDNKFDKIFNAIESKQITPKQGIFFEGQISDAHRFVSELVRNANKSIILIDNYIDDSVLTLFSKRKEGVNVTIFTKSISKELKLDLDKYNSQYPKIDVKEFKHSHDRFMIIDNKEVYHIGASLKDLGKKWFAFSKFDKKVFTLLERLE